MKLKPNTIISLIITLFLVYVFVFYKAELYIKDADHEMVDEFAFNPSEFLVYYGGANTDAGLDFTIINKEEYVVVGQTSSFGNGMIDGFVFTTDQEGEVQWSKAIGGINNDIATAVESDQDHILVAGMTGEGDELNVFVSCLNKDGDSLWMKSFGAGENSIGNDIALLNNGSIIITGNTNSFGNGADGFYFLLDQNGELKWSYSFRGQANELPKTILTNEKDIVIAGQSNSYGNGNYDLSLTRIDDEGNIVKQIVIGSSEHDYFGDMEFTDDGAIITGSSTSENGKKDVFILKLDQKYDVDWAISFKTPNQDMATAIELGQNGDYYIMGYSIDEETNDYDLYYIHTNSRGVPSEIGNLGTQYPELPNDIKYSSQKEIIMLGQGVMEQSGGYKIMFGKIVSGGLRLPLKLREGSYGVEKIHFDRKIIELEKEEGLVEKENEMWFNEIDITDSSVYYNHEIISSKYSD